MWLGLHSLLALLKYELKYHLLTFNCARETHFCRTFFLAVFVVFILLSDTVLTVFRFRYAAEESWCFLNFTKPVQTITTTV